MLPCDDLCSHVQLLSYQTLVRNLLELRATLPHVTFPLPRFSVAVCMV